MLCYEYTLAYCSSVAHGNADAMSRLPLKQQPASVPVPEEIVLLMEQLQDSLTDVTAIRKATAHHPLLSRVLQFVQQGWPNHCEEEELKPLWSYRMELSVQVGCLLWGNRVAIPPSLQSDLLLDLHAGHPGVSPMKSLSRMYIWWPGIDKDVQTMVQGCEECQHSRPALPSAPFHPWKWPGTPWSRLHLDFAGPFIGSQFLVAVDAHSKWIEVYQMASTASSTLFEKQHVLFAQFGIPQAGFYLGSNFWRGTYTSIYMYVCIYTHAWRGVAWRKQDVVYSMILKTTLMHAACISGFLSE